MTTILNSQGIHVSLDGVEVVHGASLTARPGRITTLLGPNGAGKSTTLRATLGLIPATGHIERTESIGVLLDDGGLIPGLTGRHQLEATARLAGIPKKKIQPVLEKIGMTAAADRRIKTYSLGMKRRIALGAALLVEPELLILDEPSSGLDPSGIRWLGRTLREFADAGGAVVVATHHLAEAAQIADDVVIISAGSTLYNGSLSELEPQSNSLENAYFDLVGA